MATARYASTESGALVVGSPQPITLQPLEVPVPPDPTPPPLKVPVITVHDFDGLLTPNGWDMTFDDGNGNLTHLYTKNGGLYVEVANAAGKGATGKYRRVI